MPRAERWSQLKTGLVVLAGIVVTVGAVLLFARVGALHGSTTHVYLVTDRATGVISGTEVWLGGQTVGLVSDVSLRPASVDTTERVAIGMDILSEYMRYIRKDSDVQVRPGGNLIGAPVIFLTIGTGKAPPVRGGDTLRAGAQVEERPGVADISSLGDSVSAVAAEFRQIDASLDTTMGAVATIRKRTESQVDAVRRAMDRFSERATRSRGTVSLTVRDSVRLRTEVARISAVTDSIRAAAASGNGTFGRFRRDSTLLRHARSVAASADTLRGALTRYTPHPTRGDSALARELDRVHAQLDSLVRDAKRHPLRYIAL